MDFVLVSGYKRHSLFGQMYRTSQVFIQHVLDNNLNYYVISVISFLLLKQARVFNFLRC